MFYCLQNRGALHTRGGYKNTNRKFPFHHSIQGIFKTKIAPGYGTKQYPKQNSLYPEIEEGLSNTFSFSFFGVKQTSVKICIHYSNGDGIQVKMYKNLRHKVHSYAKNHVLEWKELCAQP